MPTLWSQRGECYVQIVDFSDLDKSIAFMPPGNSEIPGSPHQRDQMIYWAEGTLRAAPISRKAVEAIKMSTMTLEYRTRKK